jgi:hypothetical protein
MTTTQMWLAFGSWGKFLGVHASEADALAAGPGRVYAEIVNVDVTFNAPVEPVPEPVMEDRWLVTDRFGSLLGMFKSEQDADEAAKWSTTRHITRVPVPVQR